MKLDFKNHDLKVPLDFQKKLNSMKVETVKMFTSTKMTHVGIIINYDINGNIIFGSSEEPYITLILECIAESKYNWYRSKISNGVGLYVFPCDQQQCTFLKRTKTEFKNLLNSENIYNFIDQYIDIPISSLIKFVGIWLGISIENDSEIICSEFCYKFYERFAGSRKIDNKNPFTKNYREIIINNPDYKSAIEILILIILVLLIFGIVLWVTITIISRKSN